MMSMRRSAVAAVVAAAIFWPALSSAQGQAPLPEVDRFGPQVGETVPDFSLIDQRGETQTLQSLMGPNGLMLVFNRSADW